jgi:ankyrin repeat protein
VTSWDAYKQTAAAPPTLAAAAKANDVALIEALLADDRSNIDERDARGYSPLMFAAYTGSLEAAQLLLARGADPNGTDFAGNSILMGAAFKGHLPLVQCLLAHGADPKHRNAAGLDAYGFALQFGRSDVLPLLTTTHTASAGSEHHHGQR